MKVDRLWIKKEKKNRNSPELDPEFQEKVWDLSLIELALFLKQELDLFLIEDGLCVTVNEGRNMRLPSRIRRTDVLIENLLSVFRATCINVQHRLLDWHRVFVFLVFDLVLCS